MELALRIGVVFNRIGNVLNVQPSRDGKIEKLQINVVRYLNISGGRGQLKPLKVQFDRISCAERKSHKSVGHCLRPIP